MNETELEQAGLLAGAETPSERDARVALRSELIAAGVPLDDLKHAVVEDRLALLPVERVFGAECKYTIAEVAARAGVSEDFIRRDLLALGLSVPEPSDVAFSDAN